MLLKYFHSALKAGCAFLVYMCARSIYYILLFFEGLVELEFE